jgi:hypothetical protein
VLRRPVETTGLKQTQPGHTVFDPGRVKTPTQCGLSDRNASYVANEDAGQNAGLMIVRRGADKEDQTCAT